MSVDECIKKYEDLIGIIFAGWPKTRLVFKGEFYSAEGLEDQIKSLIKEKLRDENALLMDDRNPCKV